MLVNIPTACVYVNRAIGWPVRGSNQRERLEELFASYRAHHDFISNNHHAPLGAVLETFDTKEQMLARLTRETKEYIRRSKGSRVLLMFEGREYEVRSGESGANTITYNYIDASLDSARMLSLTQGL